MRKNYKHSEETKEKLRMARRKRVISQETKNKLSLSLKGRKILWKDKISKSLKGKKCPWVKTTPQMFRKGMSPWNKGKTGLQKMSVETRRKMSESHKGDKAPNWKGGVSPEGTIIHGSFEYRLQKEKCLERDGHRCQICGEFDKPLEVHHVVPWKISHDDSLENLISICRKCHCTIEPRRKK